MYIKRICEDVILEISRTFRVLLVTGARQTGKTTLLKHLAEPEREYVTLDDMEERLTAIENPKLFLAKHPAPVIIDEIQNAPELLPYIKMDVDTHKEKGRYWLTGSQKFSLMKNVSESLAGRVGIFSLYGLSQAELDGRINQPFFTNHTELQTRISECRKKTLSEIYTAIFNGTMPEKAANPDIDRDRFYQSYIETYITRDINELQQVGDRISFYKFLTAAAARTGRMVNYNELAKDAGISAPTAKQWLSILIASNIVILIQPYHNNVLKRTVKAPIMHFTDTGLCAYLLQWKSPETLEQGIMAGNLFETFAVMEICKSYWNAGKTPPVYFYRDQDKKEIDLLLYQDNTLYPIEIKKSGIPDKTAVRAFKTIIRPDADPMYPKIGEGAVVCTADSIFPVTETVWTVPVWMI